MIELFAGRATEVSGIDRSAEMLRLARAKLEAAGIAADLRQGDMYALPLPSDGADTVILHQVLPYAQQPASAIAEAGARKSVGEGKRGSVRVDPGCRRFIKKKTQKKKKK